MPCCASKSAQNSATGRNGPAWPTVLHVFVVPAVYGPLLTHVVLGGTSSQNSYLGAAHPVEVAVQMIVVPGVCGEAADGVRVADVHVLTLSVKIVDGKMVVSLGSDVLFPAGSARLSKEGLQAVKEVANQLRSIPDRRYQVEGHTDNVPISTATFPSNWELASARALTVVKTMIESGMPAQRVSAASYGDSSPVQPNDTVEGKAANRRVAIVVVPDLASLPGYDELQKLSQ